MVVLITEVLLDVSTYLAAKVDREYLGPILSSCFDTLQVYHANNLGKITAGDPTEDDRVTELAEIVKLLCEVANLSTSWYLRIVP